ncbi:MAG: DUF3108 domain-containing protein [Prevotellaceae bacterium]|jgi:hypothetical protein|nr:DUF3108 domain-containing protein [Prevotellaceae bacterium]
MNKIKCFFSVLFVFIAVAAKSQTTLAFADNEKLSYVGAYSLTFIYTEVAKVNLSIEKTSNGDYHVLGDANTFKFYDNFFKVRDLYETRFCLQDNKFHSLYFHRDIKEDSYTKVNTYNFDWTAQKISGSMQKKKNPTLPYSFDMQAGKTYSDVLTCFYDFRSQNFTNIAKGKTFSFHFLLDNEFYDLQCTYQGKEVRKMKKFKNKKVNCLKFNFQVIEGNAFKGNEIIEVWLTDDKNHVPVEFEFPIRIGRMRAYISEYKNLKYPINFVE